MSKPLLTPLFTALFFSSVSWAGDNLASFVIESRITLRSQNDQLLLEPMQDREYLRLVNQQDSVTLSVKASLTRVSPTEIHFDLGTNFDLRAYDNGQVSELSLQEFVLQGPEDKINKMMELRPQAIVTERNVHTSDTISPTDFISLMNDTSHGIDSNMVQVRDEGLPLRVLGVKTLSLNIDAESVLKDGVTKLLLASYWVDIHVKNNIFSGYAGPTHVRLESLGDVLAADDSFILNYRRAVADLRERFTTLDARGWSDGIFMAEENRRLLEEGAEFDPTNVAPLAPAFSCHGIF